ncbi:MAG: PAS domain-containing sensor histidine kinase [Methanophagales archaeon]|nr:PAS domain-containing sensor histidine kinase [Methanophagales archaeon]
MSEEKRIKRSYKFLILLLSVSTCVIMTVYFASTGETGVYTHLFYIPIILAGVWYKKKAVYLAFILGAIHIFTTLFFIYHPPVEILIETSERAGMLIVVAYAIGLVRERCVRAQDELRDAEERYRVIFEYALTALCVIEHGEVVSLANKEFETLSGYSREEIKGKKWIDFIADEDMDRVQNYCEERRKGEAPACCEFKFVSRNGEIKHVNAWIEPVPGASSCVASLLDITELKRKEEELRETCEKLAELDKMKRDFLNVAYHELRSPLAPIVGYASMLERYKLPDKERRYLYTIEQSARQLEKLINRMLELARIDGKKIELSLEGVHIPEVVEEVIKSLEPEAKEKRQKISTSIPEIEIQADKQKIIAIFINLISNAIKYTPEKGRIDIKVEDRGEDIRVCVADTGIGIPEEHLSKIFERFYMVDTSLTRKSGALGLGLSIVKEYVKLHGGKVWATSEPGKGSKFFFTLPKRQ